MQPVPSIPKPPQRRTSRSFVPRTSIRPLASIVACLFVAAVATSVCWAQRPAKRLPRATPPMFKPGEFSGVFYEDATSVLQGTRPSSNAAAVPSPNSSSNDPSLSPSVTSGEPSATGDNSWKALISNTTIEDFVKETKGRLDQSITTPAKFAGGGFAEARREFTLLATLMGIINQYPDQIRWKSSAAYGQSIFARMAANCKVGTQPVYNEAKLRLADLQELLKGSNLTGNADEVTWESTADRGPVMQLLEWALRKNLLPATSSDKEFQNAQEDVLKYAELIAVYGKILHMDGMTDASDETYAQLAQQMSLAAQEAASAAKIGNAEAARAAVGKIDQSCNKCHESYR